MRRRACRWVAWGGSLLVMLWTWRRRVAMSSNRSLAQKRGQEMAQETVQEMAASLPRVAVLVPCYNEERAITKVIADFRTALPQATIYVYDNNSKDNTVAAARAAGAVVRSESH